MRNISHHNQTSKNFIKTLFKATKLRSRVFNSVFGLLLLLLSAGAAYVVAQSTGQEEFHVRTIHVFPSDVTANGWDNVDTITNQNLAEYDLFQAFNSINSAHLKTVKPIRTDVDSDTEPAAGVIEGDTELENLAIEAEVDSNETTASSTASEAEPVADSSVASSTEAVENSESVIDTTEVPTDSIEPVVEDESETESTTSASSTEQSVLHRATQVFAVVSGLFDFAQAQSTSSLNEATSSTEFVVTDPVIDERAVEPESTDISTTSLPSQVLGTSTTPTTATTAEQVVDEVASGNRQDNDVERSATTSIESTSTPGTDEVVTEESAQECADCPRHTMTLKDFGLPIEQTLDGISGAQLRVSLGAQSNDFYDVMPMLSIRYSFDTGESWNDLATVVIDGEVSNSLNGGYYLFALPAMADASQLDDLHIELAYEGKQSQVEELYIDSAWLEVFALERTVIEPTDLIKTFDNRFDDQLLSGDQLVTADGEVITFTNTDDNADETLIIKSDQTTYSGLSQTTTYFSVTNTSENEDDFTLQTYFPQDNGEVLELEEWQQNKPKEVVVPEYRPFVYHCEAGWEYSGEPIGGSLFELSLQLSPTEESEPAENSQDETATTSSEREDEVLSVTEVASSSASSSQTSVRETETEIIEDDAEINASSSSSTPQLQSLLTPAPFAQQSTVAPAVEEFDGDEIVAAEDAAVSASLETYACRNTNLVRTCDSITADNTECRVENVKVDEAVLTQYERGWQTAEVSAGELPEPHLLKKIGQFFGMGPETKEVPAEFAVKAHTPETYSIEPGETKYFKMEIAFEPMSSGEYWIEAIGDTEYGLLDPYWSSQWQYRLPISVDNTAGSTLSEYQVFLEIDNTLTDFWSNVNSDGSDVRFVQETTSGNEESWYGTGWASRIPITIDATQVDTNLSDFPVYVDLADLGSGFFTDVQSSGDDIRITQADGLTEEPYELVAINTGAETGELHFQATSISSSTNTTFYVYYDNPNVSGYAETDTYGAQNVWGSEYIAVYHMEEAAGGRGNDNLYQDSTDNEYDADDELTSTGKAGQLGAGQEVDAQGDANEYILLPSDVASGESQLTFSYWMNSTEGNNQALVNGGADNDYLLFLTNGGSTLQLFDSGSVSEGLDSDISTGDWRHIMVGRDADNNEWRIFVDGVEDADGAVGDTMSPLSLAADCFVIGLEQDTTCLNSGDTSQHLSASIDEMRFRNDIPSPGEAAAMYRNQATTTDFYTVGSVNSFITTEFTELDFWLQHFDSTNEEADVWVQVENLAAGASTTIELYYGNVAAVSASDEKATFTYSTSTPLYYVVDGNSTGDIEVFSLIDNNTVSFDGTTYTALDEGESVGFSGYSSSTVISAVGPISATINDARADSLTPIAFATTTHVIATNRNTSQYFIHAPFASTTVRTYIAGSAVADEVFSIEAGNTLVSNTDAGGNEAVIIEASSPILVYHQETSRDSIVVYPPTTRDLFGIDTGTVRMSTLVDDPDPTTYCSDGVTTGTESGVTRGEAQAVNTCTGVGDGQGDAIRLTAQASAITANQQGDGDGGETSVFWPQHEFGTQYIMTTDSAYAAIACSPRFGTTTIEVQTIGGASTADGPVDCVPDGEFPGKVYFNNGQDGDALAFTAGHQVISTNGVPFYVMYEDDEEDNDETNILGAVQARKYDGTAKGYSFGAQELIIDAEYNQLSFAWYENVNAQTPTDLWSLGDDGDIAEGEAITGQGSINANDVFRLRMNLEANVATGTASSTAFALQYAEAETCTTATNWQDIGTVGSTTAAFSGYNNTAIDDGATLSTVLLGSSTVLATYEEASLSEFIPNDIGIGEVAEWDWVLTNSNAETNTNYCFRMVRATGDPLASYTIYPQVLTSGPPNAANLFKRFDNEHASSARPTLEFVASDPSGDELHYQVQIDDDNDFSSVTIDQSSDINFLQFANTVDPADKAPFTSGRTIRYTPPSDLVSSTTYWWRVRSIDTDGSNTYSDWSSSYSFTINEAITVSEWYQTTDEQFETNSLTSAITSGSGSVVPDIGGSGIIGEYGSVTVTNGATTTVNLNNTYTTPVVTASVEYSRSVPNGDQPAARVFNKTGTDFDVLSENFTGDAPGTSTVHYVVMEAGEYLIDDGADGLRAYATTSSISSYIGASITGDPGTTLVFPTAFSSAPVVLTMVTTNNDPQWVLSGVYDGNSVNNPPTASQVGVFLHDNIASDGHGSAEDIDLIAFDPGIGTNNGTAFDMFNTGIDDAVSYVDDTPDSFTFSQTFSTVPGVTAVQMLTVNGNQGGYAMVDTDTPVSTTAVSIAIEEGGTTGARTHADEDVSVVVFEDASGDIIRAGNGQMTSTVIDFDDADVGNAWGEVDFTDSGDLTYHLEYQTGSGFADIPDSDLPSNSSGFTSGPFSILNLDPDTYDQIRIVVELAGASPELFDWTVRWGQRVDTPTLGDPFDNEKIATTTPTFDFVSTDPQGDALQYQISWSTDDTFTSSTTYDSAAGGGFAPGHPYASGATVTYTIESGDALSNLSTYWWRVRAKDPAGGNAWSPWSLPDSFTVDTSTVVSTWFQTTQEQFEEGILDGLTASTSDQVVVSAEIGEYGTTTVSNNDWLTINTQLTYNNMVVVASPEYAFNGTDNGRTVQVRNKTSDSFEIKAENYTESLSGSTDVDYIVMEAGDWLISDGAAGTRILAGTAASVSTVKGSSPGYNGGTLIDFTPDFSGVPGVLTTISTANGSKWVGSFVDDGTQDGVVGAGDMYLSLGISLDSDTVREPEDIDYLAFDQTTGTNDTVLFDAFNTGLVVTESETESTVSFNQTFTSAPGVIVVQNNANNGGDGGFAQVDTDTAVTNTEVDLTIAEIGAGAGNHAAEVVSVLAFEDGSGRIRREASTASGLVGTIASEPILFSDGAGPKFERALFSTTSPGFSSTTLQVQYQVSSSSWALIPDAQITGNSTGITASPVDLTSVDIVSYPVIRLLASLQCDVSNCPTLEDWTLEWSEGVPISGTIQAYDRSTNVTSGTVRVAVNGTPGSTGSIAGDGTWTINNVTAFDGDVVTVWVEGAAEANEAVTVFVYDGIGDMTGIELYEQHLSLSADENGTSTNALLGAYDNSVSGDEDIFFDVNAQNDLTVCTITGCDYANLYIGSGDIYVPDSSNSGNVTTHDFINDGTFDLDVNTMRVSGSWDDNASTDLLSSTVIFTATSTIETIDDSDNLLDFGTVTFGETSGTAQWQSMDPLDIDGDLSVNYGTFDRTLSAITVAGDISTGAAGVWSGLGTTTFDGSGSSQWSDATIAGQSIGYAVIDGSAKTVIVQSDVLAESITIGVNDTLSAGGANTISVAGDFTNNNIFTAQTGTVAIVGPGTSAIVTTGGSSLYSFTASTTANGSVAFTESSVTMLGDLTIATGTVTMPTVSASIGGSFSNAGGVFAHNNALVRFTSSGSETIELGGTVFFNHLYDVSFTGSGDWTFLDAAATTSNNFTITNGEVTFPSEQLSIARDLSVSGGGSFAHNGGEVLFLIRADDTITTNGSTFNDVRVREGSPLRAGNYDENWLYRDMITINASEIDDDLTNFPVYLDLADFSTSFFNNINVDGGDIRITTSDGETETAREIVSVSTGTETGEVHFLAPTLSSSTDSIFYIYYGNSGASDYAIDDTYGAENVWDDDYLAVYHMQSEDSVDSTSFDRDAVAVGDTPTTAAGRFGGAVSITDNGGSDYIDLQSDLSELDGLGEMTVSAWVNVSDDANDDVIFTRGPASTVELIWDNINGSSNNDTWTFNAGNTGTGANRVDAAPSGISVGDTWQFVTGAMNGGNRYIYVDGLLRNTSTGAETTLRSNSSGSYIGYWVGSAGFDYDGLVDEYRISRVERSADWIAAEYSNLSTSTDFYTYSGGSVGGSRIFAGATASTEGDVTIESGQVQFPSTDLNIAGSFDNDGTFVAGSGAVTFTATTGAHTIAPGVSSFYDLTIDASGGDLSVSETATATNAITLSDANAFTVNSGITLASAGTFSNQLINASTTWTGATLLLSGGTDFALNTKENDGDTYNILSVIGDGDVKMWNSTASTYDTQDTASIYSQDHAAIDGDLYIFGDYVRETGIEYWRYDTDFDGAGLVASSSERQVNVRIANGSNVAASSSELELVGSVTASTTVAAQSGSYTFSAEMATVTAEYLELAGADASGLQLLSSTTMASFANTEFTIPGGSAALTIDASTIDSNPEAQFFNNDFVTGGGNVNATLSGVPTSYWWFREGAGDRYGEAFDNDGADPGAIRWDDSNYQIDISGTIYADAGSAALGGPTCDGGTNAVTIVVDGGTYTDTQPCNGIDGSYSFSNVSYNGDATILVYLDDAVGGETGSVITRTPTTDITDLDIYTNRVITRHEDSAAMSINRLALFDESDDADIRFVAATSSTANTLTVRPDTELYVWDDMTFAPAGVVTLQSGGSGASYDGTLYLAATSTFTGTGTTTYSIGGSLILEADATFTAASSTVSMTATTTGKTITASSTVSFYDLTFTGVGGGWNVNTNIVAAADILVATGTLTGTGDITLTDGSFSGDGLVSLGGGTTLLYEGSTLGGVQGWTFNNLTLGNGSIVGTTTPGSTATTSIGGVLTISAAHFLDAGNSAWNLTGSGSVFVETGTFLEDTSTVRYGGVTGSTVLNTDYYNLVVDAVAGAPTYTAAAGGIQVFNNLAIGQTSATTFTLTAFDPVVAVTGDVLVAAAGTFVASDSSTLTLYGSWDNNGTFTSENGLVDFASADAFTIAAGASTFADTLISGAGAATLSEHATSTGSWTLATTSDFTVAAGQHLAVGGDFSNNAAGAATTWTDSTLHLFGAGQFEINASTTADTYGTLSAAANTHIRMWNSTSTFYTTAAGGSVYSMDHNASDGILQIYGDYEQAASDDYWSYAADFDGTDLSGGAERAVTVYVENNGSVEISGTGGLAIAGAAGATTTVGVLGGAGTYSMDVSGGTFTAQNYRLQDMDADGLTFTGTPTVGTLSDGEFIIGSNNARGLVVAGSVIDANPAKNFANNIFATTTGITTAFNASTTGSTVSSWRFTTHGGDVDGEDFDLDGGGDPGYLVWDDSTPEITISGRVYENDGTTVSSVCGTSATNILLAVDGVVTPAASSTCDGSGNYSISNVSFSPNDTLTLFIDGESDQGVTVSIDPISTVGNMDIYEDHVIVRHEGSSAITIADMADYDSSDDGDIPFTATLGGTDTLVLDTDTKLLIWTNKEFAPTGNITTGGGSGSVLDGTIELQDDSTLTLADGELHSVGGNMEVGTGSTIEPAESSVTFTSGGAGRTIATNEAGFHDLTINSAGSYTSNDTVLTVASDLTLTAGALTLPAATTSIGGSLTTTAGSFAANGGILDFTSAAVETVTAAGSAFADVIFSGSGSWTLSDTNATTTGSVKIESGAVTMPSGTLAVAGNFRNTGGSFAHNSGVLAMSTTSQATILASSSDLYAVTMQGGIFAFEDENLALLDSLTITNATTTLASGTLSIGGSLDAALGTFAHASGTILFNSSDTGETITSGQNDFYNVQFGSAAGGWTMIGNATTTNNFVLLDASDYTQQTGTRLYVGNVFTNLVGGLNTTWTNTVLELDSGDSYTINSKTAGGDDYETIQLGANTDVRVWDSQAAATLLAASASLYSQDNAGTPGELYIFGDFHVGTSTEYWSYATDFDGVALGGSSRAVTVRLAAGATTTVDGGSLQMIGAVGATTTVTNQGSGTYSFGISDGSFAANYYAYRNLNVAGVSLSGAPTIGSLDDGDFELAVDGGSLITLSSTTLSANPSKFIDNVRFATTSLITGTNVNLNATTATAWTFRDHVGNISGEEYDSDGLSGNDCGSIRWDDSSCLLVQQAHYRWRNDDGGLGVPAAEWYDTDWDARKRVRVENQDNTTYATTAVKVALTYDSDMQSDFEDLRFTESDGTTLIPHWIEQYTASTDAVVWIQIPSLPANDTYDAFVYYDNVAAVSTSSSTPVFIAADSFEDNNIAEYSGDTAKFQTAAASAFGGSYGVEPVTDTDFTNNGIARFDQTIGQGQIVRYMQYVDTAGSSDESCMLFGVQSPVTNNENYAVCIELFGTDRLALVRDAERSDNFGSVVALSSTPVSYTTGWYEVEIDWQSNDDIDVSLFTEAGTLVATTSATDSTYTDGGYGFTYWGQTGGWDSVVVRNRTDSNPTVLFGAEQADGGATWNAALDSPSQNIQTGDVARLRFAVENTGLDITGETYQLEVAAKGAAPSCESVSAAAYAAVEPQATCGSDPICMISSTQYADGDATVDLLSNTSGAFVSGFATEDPSNTASSLDIDQNEYTELEYAIESTINVSDNAYCLRVTDGGDDLDAYNAVAEFALQFEPTFGPVSFNNGADIALVGGTTTVVYATATVTDLNGFTDLNTATATMYTTSAGGACSPDANNCYISTTTSQCSFSNCAGNSCTLSCYADFIYHADPTDSDGGEEWFAFLEASDDQGGSNFATSPGIDLLTLRSLQVDSEINYGSLAVTQDTGGNNASTTIENIGNDPIDIQIEGSDLSDGVSSQIPANQQLFATSTFTYSACTICNSVPTSTPAVLEVDLLKPTSAAAPVEDEVYWGIAIPFGTASNPHSGINIFYAVGD
ncbi:DUF2341 domain-containing protein [Candidatus Pacebacteria bacterium]|nr:DUF2341 domain-containing protein [Candidatus Paceibacterota bacterium]